MRRFLTTSALALSLSALIAMPALAGVFTVTMTSGATFLTRYQPHQSDTHEDKVLLLTEFGNWISLPKAAIQSVTSETEARGFGTVIDSQTIALGWIPNSSLPASDSAGADELDPTTRLINFMREQNAPAPQPVYNNELVVEPSALGGIPIGFSNRTTPPIGDTGGGRNPQ